MITKPEHVEMQKLTIEYPGRFSKSDIREIRRSGGTYHSSKALAEFRNYSGEYLFSGNNIAKLIFNKVKPKQIAKFRNIRGEKTDFTGTEITRILIKERSHRRLKKILKIKSNEDFLFDEKSFTEFVVNGFTYKNVYKVLKVCRKLKISPSAYQYMRILSKRIPDVKSYAKMSYFNFNEEEFTRYCEADGKPDYAQILFAAGFSGRSVYRFQQLGLSLDEIINPLDSEKPDAVILFAEYDYNDEFETEASIRLFKEICHEYDCYVRIVKSEDEIYRILNEKDSINLLWIAGHGLRSGIILSEEADNIDSSDYEKYIFDTDDVELSNIRGVSEISTIFLDACETGKELPSADNFAEFIKKNLPEANVIYSDRVFSHDEIILDRIYPLEIRFLKADN